MAKQSSTNAIDLKWMKVVDRKGDRLRASLREVLIHPGDYMDFNSVGIDWIANNTLCSGFYRAVGTTAKELADLAKTGELPHGMAKRLDEYLERYYDAFEILGDGRRFNQVPYPGGAVKARDQLKPITAMRFDAASGDNATLASHEVDEKPKGVTVEDVTQLLVTYPMFALAGTMRGAIIDTDTVNTAVYAADAPMSRSARFMWKGDTLAQTFAYNTFPIRPEDSNDPLLLNEKIYKYDLALDRPFWESGEIPYYGTNKNEKGKPAPIQHQIHGPLSLLTCPSRQICLFQDDDGLFRWVFIGQGWVAAREAVVSDPFKMRQQSSDPQKADFPWSNLMLEHNHDGWRDFEAIVYQSKARKSGNGKHETERTRPAIVESGLYLRKRIKDTPMPRLVVAGLIVTPKQPTIEAMRHEVYSMPRDLFDDEAKAYTAIKMIELADAVKNALVSQGIFRAIVEMMKLSEDDDPVKKRKIEFGEKQGRFSPKAEIAYWAKVGVKFPKMFAALDNDPDKTLSDWKQLLYDAARDAYRTALSGLLVSAARYKRGYIAGEATLLRKMAEILELQTEDKEATA